MRTWRWDTIFIKASVISILLFASQAWAVSENAKRDGNRVRVMLGVTDDTALQTRMLRVHPDTGQLLTTFSRTWTGALPEVFLIGIPFSVTIHGSLTLDVGQAISIDHTVTVTGTVSLGPGSASIGTLGANGGVLIGDVNVFSTGSLTAIGKLQNSSVPSFGVGSALLAERDDVLSTLGPSNSNFAWLKLNDRGALWIEIDTGLASIGTVGIDAGTNTIGKLGANAGINIGSIEGVIGGQPMRVEAPPGATQLAVSTAISAVGNTVHPVIGIPAEAINAFLTHGSSGSRMLPLTGSIPILLANMADTGLARYVRQTASLYEQSNPDSTTRQTFAAHVAPVSDMRNPLAVYHLARNRSTFTRALGFRRNELYQSEDFSGTPWLDANVIITDNDILGPDGTSLADRFAPDATESTERNTYQEYNGSANGIDFHSVWIKPRGAQQWVTYNEWDYGSGWVAANFDILNGILGHVINVNVAASQDLAILDYGIQPYPEGWYKIWMFVRGASSTRRGIQINAQLTNTLIGPGPEQLSTSDGMWLYGAMTIRDVQYPLIPSPYIAAIAGATTDTSSTQYVGDFHLLPGGTMDVLSVIPGTGITNLGKLVGGASNASDVGVLGLGVFRDPPEGTVGVVAGDHEHFVFNSEGVLYVVPTLGVTGASGASRVSIEQTATPYTTASGETAVGAHVKEASSVEGGVALPDSSHMSLGGGKRPTTSMVDAVSFIAYPLSIFGQASGFTFTNNTANDGPQIVGNIPVLRVNGAAGTTRRYMTQSGSLFDESGIVGVAAHVIVVAGPSTLAGIISNTDVATATQIIAAVADVALSIKSIAFSSGGDSDVWIEDDATTPILVLPMMHMAVDSQIFLGPYEKGQFAGTVGKALMVKSTAASGISCVITVYQ